ncbi:MAG: N-acetylmuramoyl-L-alanine amidase [Citromicrobium sp.]|nr:MAG: N-acetylmuramoyl-L-alanine amidase [Citromicrobium sp.]
MLHRWQPLIMLSVSLAAIIIALVWAFTLARPDQGAGFVARVELPQTQTEASNPVIGGPPTLPLVVIDPGHGGHDAGASGHGFEEKSLVLGLADALRRRLIDDGTARVALTREDDRYLLHAERYELARRLGADLFISIHADSAGDSEEVTGASIYTLSDQASSEAAARFALRENASDRLNGVDLGSQNDQVSSILVELSQRRIQEKSDEMAALIEREGQGALQFHPQPRHFAALKVLRAPDVPSVLFESGFISNEADAARLASEEGKQRFAKVLSRAVEIYFIRNPDTDE